MKITLISFLCVTFSLQHVLADGSGLACEVPSLSEADFKAAVGPAAVKFSLTAVDGKSCVYEHPGGASIRISLQSSGNYAIDEFNSKKEEDFHKAKSSVPVVEGVPMDVLGVAKPEDIGALGASAYKTGNRSDVIVNVLDQSKKDYFDVEVKLYGLNLSAIATAKKLARSIETNFSQQNRKDLAGTQESARPIAECLEKLSAEDIQGITGLSPGQYDIKRGNDNGCIYDAKISDYAHRLFRFSALKPATNGEANLILNNLRSHSLNQNFDGVGVMAGIMASNEIWFVSTNRKWIVTVGYYEISSRDSDQLAYSQSEKDKIRDDLARAIDKNLSGPPL